MEPVVSYLFATISVVTTLGVVVLPRAVYGALSLIVCLASVAILFLQLFSTGRQGADGRRISDSGDGPGAFVPGLLPGPLMQIPSEVDVF